VTTFKYSELNDFLEDRFDDIDEIRDITTYGMSMGVGGFVYHSELADIYEQYEDQIKDLLDSHGINDTELVPDYEDIQVKEAAVWYAVETWCHQTLEAYQEQEQENEWKEEQEEQQSLADELLAAALA